MGQGKKMYDQGTMKSLSLLYFFPVVSWLCFQSFIKSHEDPFHQILTREAVVWSCNRHMAPSRGTSSLTLPG